MARPLLVAALLLASLPALANDPNCSATVRQGSAIRNHYTGATSRNLQDGNSAIAALDFAELYRKPPFRITKGSVRLDAQGLNSDGDANLQIQLNGVSGKSTIAHVQVAAELGGASTPDRAKYVQRKVRGALLKSMETGRSYTVSGDCS